MTASATSQGDRHAAPVVVDAEPSTDSSRRDATASEDRVILAEHLCKKYRLYDSPWHRLAERFSSRPKHQVLSALEDVSFDLTIGRGLGIIGHNGAGKSTLLKLVAGVLLPSSGRLEVQGPVSSILELGAGFHPDFTGLQNVRIAAAMLGLSAAEVRERLPAIVDFCELGHFLDQPVKVYSSGMSMRLAFSIATQVSPRVLIIDEALSVGDGYFQKKCTDRIATLIDQGTSLLLSSHAMYYVERFCEKVLWLDHGHLIRLGEAHDVIWEYERALERQRGEAAAAALPANSTAGHQENAVPLERGAAARIRDVQVLFADHAAPGRMRPLEPWAVEIEWEADDAGLEFHLAVGVDRSDGVQVFCFSSMGEGHAPLSGEHSYRVRVGIDELPLNLGEYEVHVYLMDSVSIHAYEHRVLHQAFVVSAEKYVIGLLKVPFTFERLEPGHG